MFYVKITLGFNFNFGKNDDNDSVISRNERSVSMCTCYDLLKADCAKINN